MLKLLLILLVGLTFESTGVVLLKKGMTHIGDMNGITAAEIFRVCKAGATNPQILLGVFFEALFFLCLLILMSKKRHQLPLAADRIELCVRHLRRHLVFERARLGGALDWRGLDRDRRGVHQLQPARKGKTRTAIGAIASHGKVILTRTLASRSAANLQFFWSRNNPPVFPGDLAMAQKSLP